MAASLFYQETKYFHLYGSATILVASGWRSESITNTITNTIAITIDAIPQVKAGKDAGAPKG